MLMYMGSVAFCLLFISVLAHKCIYTRGLSRLTCPPTLQRVNRGRRSFLAAVALNYFEKRKSPSRFGTFLHLLSCCAELKWCVALCGAALHFLSSTLLSTAGLDTQLPDAHELRPTHALVLQWERAVTTDSRPCGVVAVSHQVEKLVCCVELEHVGHIRHYLRL